VHGTLQQLQRALQDARRPSCKAGLEESAEGLQSRAIQWASDLDCPFRGFRSFRFQPTIQALEKWLDNINQNISPARSTDEATVLAQDLKKGF